MQTQTQTNNMSQVFMQVNVKIAAIFVLAPNSVADGYRCFGKNNISIFGNPEDLLFISSSKCLLICSVS
jgi:hypothetical protein